LTKEEKSYKRVWKARSLGSAEDLNQPWTGAFWEKSISDMDNDTIQNLLERVGMQVCLISYLI
jgi:hypothetical protein